MKAIIQHATYNKRLTAKMQAANIVQAYLYTLIFTGRLVKEMLAVR